MVVVHTRPRPYGGLTYSAEIRRPRYREPRSKIFVVIPPVGRLAVRLCRESEIDQLIEGLPQRLRQSTLLEPVVEAYRGCYLHSIFLIRRLQERPAQSVSE